MKYFSSSIPSLLLLFGLSSALVSLKTVRHSQISSPLHFLKPFRNWFSRGEVDKPVIISKPIIETDIAIIGAGAAGLACAIELLKNNVKDFIVLESSDSPGGRIKTDIVDGFLLDRGFQVFIEGYPESRRILDYSKLDLKPFSPGAFVKYQNKLHTVSDPLRRPGDLLATISSPIGSLLDKLKVGIYSQQVKFLSLDQIWAKEERTTDKYLQNELGVSPAMVNRFFTPFYQGIFLSPLSLQSSRMFEFVFKMFGESSASLPAQGMGQVCRQLADQLPTGTIKLNTRVLSINDTWLVCEAASTTTTSSGSDTGPVGGVDVRFRRAVLAVDPPSIPSLLSPVAAPLDTPEARSSNCLYYAIDGPPPVTDPVLILNGDDDNNVSLGAEVTRAVVNNVCFPSQVSAAYAPPGKSLASVTVVGALPGISDDVLDFQVRQQLEAWFPSSAAASGDSTGDTSVKMWKLLKIYRIPYAQPAQTPPYKVPTDADDYSLAKLAPNLYVCGDYRGTATLNGAFESGRKAAQLILMDMKNKD